MSGLKNLRRCHICQEYGDHWTPRCPKLMCAECDEMGHSKLVCPYLLDEYVALLDNEEAAEPDSDHELVNNSENEHQTPEESNRIDKTGVSDKNEGNTESDTNCDINSVRNETEKESETERERDEISFQIWVKNNFVESQKLLDTALDLQINVIILLLICSITLKK